MLTLLQRILRTPPLSLLPLPAEHAARPLVVIFSEQHKIVVSGKATEPWNTILTDNTAAIGVLKKVSSRRT